MTGSDPLHPSKVWWAPDLPTVFSRAPATRRAASLPTIDRIVHVLENDLTWSDGPELRNAYRMARYWIASGRWDLILVVLHLEGRTQYWPSHSLRWGSQAFNELGFPNTGLISILSLQQASFYAGNGGPDRSAPFPMQHKFLQASNWRSAWSPIQDISRHPMHRHRNRNSCS